MDEATRKAVENAYSQCMSAARLLKHLLDGDKAQRVPADTLKGASIAGVVLTPADLARIQTSGELSKTDGAHC